jgi:hypothetical protein
VSEELLVEAKETLPFVRHCGDQLLFAFWQPDELTLSNAQSTLEEEELNEVDDMHLVYKDKTLCMSHSSCSLLL